MFSAFCGDDYALNQIKDGFKRGFVQKCDFEKALQQHKDAKDDIQRDQSTANLVYNYI